MPARIAKRSFDDHDPLDTLWAPPLDETLTEKEARIHSEAEAKRISDQIDEDIDKQRNAEKKGPRPVKVLLLGQSESGKSTTLKNFQLISDAKAFRMERASWRAIIQLNVVRSIHIILDTVTRAHQIQNQDDIAPTASFPQSLPDLPYIESDLLKLKARLTPLLKAEQVLIRRLTPPGSGEFEPTQFESIVPQLDMSKRTLSKEVAINSTIPWKDVFTKFMPSSNGSRQSVDSCEYVDWDDPEDPGRVLHDCAEDMKRLWNHRTVQELLERQNMRLEEMAGFFLDCLDDVTKPRYLPTDDHILRARLKTLGVSEHRVKLAPEGAGPGLGRDWRIFDVGGHRSLRAAWAPYFDDMDAIIFLAPISAFDQVLAEAPKVNRLEDSVKIWTQICSNKLLRDTNIILFLNKCDIMRTKLAAGIKLRDYVVSYGSRPNDFDTASNYLKKKFAGILKENSPVPRVFYCHLTSVIDTRSTKKVIANVKDMLMRENLKSSTLIL